MLLTRKSTPHAAPPAPVTRAANGRLARGLAGIPVKTLDRRTFLKRSGVTVGAGAVASQLPFSIVDQAQAQSDAPKVEVKRTVCTHCSVGCAIDAVVENGVWVRQEPVFDSPLNLGAHCAKGASIREHGIAHDSHRLKSPMKLSGSWEAKAAAPAPRPVPFRNVRRSTVFAARAEAARVVRDAVLADGGAFGAVRAQVDGRVEHRLVADPDAVLHVRVDRAAHRAVRAHGALHLDLARVLVLGLRLADHAERHLRRERGGGASARGDAGALEEGAAIDGLGENARKALREAALRGDDGSVRFSGQQHRALLRPWSCGSSW